MENKETQQETEEQQTTKGFDLQKDLKAGYVIGLKHNGEYVFTLLGTEPNLVELLGLHKIASKKVEWVYSKKELSGDALIIEAFKVLTNKLAAAESAQKIAQKESL